MPKKIGIKTLKSKTSNKVVKKETLQGMKESKTKKPVNKTFFVILIAAFVLFFIGEIYYVTKKTIDQNRRPEFVSSWQKINLGYTHAVIYSDIFYMIDNERGQIYKYEKNTGKSLQVLTFDEGVFGIARVSDGKEYILHKNNLISVFSPDGKLLNKINLGPGNVSYLWIDTNSKDDIYLVDGVSAKISKFDSTMKKNIEFGGKGEGKDKFSGSLSKIIISKHNDDIYCIENINKQLINIKIFNPEGKFRKVFTVKHIKQISNLENLAISPNGDIYINDFGGSKVIVYNNNGKYLGAFDIDINKQFLIKFPASICGDKENFYVPTHAIGIFKYIKY